MSQEQSNHSQSQQSKQTQGQPAVKWFRFPVFTAPAGTEDWEDDWIDVRADSIIAIKRGLEDVGGLTQVVGSHITISSGDNFIVNIYPDTLRGLLGYYPVRVEKDEGIE